jgi:hypothetical protein
MINDICSRIPLTEAARSQRWRCEDVQYTAIPDRINGEDDNLGLQLNSLKPAATAHQH